MDMVLGETIIQDVEGLSVEIRRSLRDLMYQLPVVEAAIKVTHFLRMNIYVKFVGHRKNYNLFFFLLGYCCNTHFSFVCLRWMF